MSYIALHYVKIKGRKYMPSEIIDETLDSAVEERLIGLGAIRKEAQSNAFEREERIAQPVKPARKQTSAKKEQHNEAEEADETIDIPQINAMDGIVGHTAKRGKRK